MARPIYSGPWRIDVDVRPTAIESNRLPIAVAALARCVAAALDTVRAPSPASIGLILSDDVELADLNAEHMGKTEPTDVLSFPLLPPEAFAVGSGTPAGAEVGSAGASSPGSAGTPDWPRPPGVRLHLGDIVVSIERAVEQASAGRGGQTGDVRWSVADELRLLVTHGTLHICGMDHAEPIEEAAMRALERQLLARSSRGES